MRLAPVVIPLFSAIGLVSPTSAGPARFPATPSGLPLRFEENRGQGPAEALFGESREEVLGLAQSEGREGPVDLERRGRAAARGPGARCREREDHRDAARGRDLPGSAAGDRCGELLEASGLLVRDQALGGRADTPCGRARRRVKHSPDQVASSAAIL